MKIYIIIVAILSFCLLFPTLIVGKTEDKPAATSYVAEMKKKETVIGRKAESSYINSRKNSGAGSEDSYVAERKRKNSPVQTSYVNSQKNGVINSASSYVKNHSTQILFLSYVRRIKPKSHSAEGNVNKIRRTTMVSSPIKKIWKKVFSAKKAVINSQIDFSFNQADNEMVERWAEQQGKLHVVKRVLRKYGEAIKVLALEFGIDFRIIVAICAHESGGYPDVTSSAKAKGLMQLKPSTAATYGLPDSLIYDPQLNLRAGTRHFKSMLNLFGNIKDAIYAYGWGQGAARTGLDAGIKADELRGVQEVLYLIQVQ